MNASAPGFRRVLPRQNAMRGERAQESLSVRVQTQVCRVCRVAPQTARQSLQFPFDPPTVFAVGGFSILRIPRLKTLNVDCQKIASHTVCIRDCTVDSDLQVPLVRFALDAGYELLLDGAGSQQHQYRPAALAGVARVRIYPGVRVLVGAAPNGGFLAELPLQKPSGSVLDGLLTLVPGDPVLNANSGVAAWARVVTAGEILAPMVVDALVTNATAARQRGIAVLADAGRQIELSLRLPVLAETGIIVPGAFVDYQDGSVSRRGLVRSTQVEAGLPEVWQTLGVQTYA